MSSERLLHVLAQNFPMPGGSTLELWLQALPTEIKCVLCAAIADSIAFETRESELGVLTRSFVEHMHRVVGTPSSGVELMSR